MERHSAELLLHDKQGTAFRITDGTKYLGHLEVRDGSLLWYPKGKQLSWVIGWDRLAERALSRELQGAGWHRSQRTFGVRSYLRRSRV